MGFNRIWRSSGIAFDTVDMFVPDIQFFLKLRTRAVPCPSRGSAVLSSRNGRWNADHEHAHCC
jgi:hypothetical protein